MTEEAVSAVEAPEVQEGTLTGDHEKCTKQSVPIAARNVKFHSSQMKTDRFFVGIASEREKTAEIEQKAETNN